MKNYSVYITTLALFSGSMLFTSCGDDTKTDNAGDSQTTIDHIDTKIVEDTKTPPDIIRVKIGGKFFTIPSPVQTAFLVKEEGSDFNSELLNDVNNVDKYTTSFQKALNMGVYGADLGYITIYENTDLSLKYLKSVRKIAGQLDLSGAFNEDIAKRFNNSMGIQDSMLVLVNEAYKNADDYLKNNDKSNIAALVVIGGWVEAVYFASQSALETKNEKLIERVAEQKQALKNMVAMLKSLDGFSEQEDYEDLTIDLEDLLKEFETITFSYEYAEPVTDPVKKVTVINSKNNINISDEVLSKIVESLASIRKTIVG